MLLSIVTSRRLLTRSVGQGPANLEFRRRSVLVCLFVTLGKTESLGAVQRGLNVTFGPEVGRDDPLNLSISLSGGKETNEDSLSNGE